MVIVIVTNYLNHHQLPWIECLRKHEKLNVTVVTTTNVPTARREMGYSNYDELEYNLHYYDNLHKDRIRDLIIYADVMIMGGTFVEDLINLRLTTKRLLLFYSERWHKRYRSYLVQPFRLMNGFVYKHYIRFNKENCYMLCNGAYVPNDCLFNFSFKDRTYKWGYFPKREPFDVEKVLEKRCSNRKVELVWVARFVKFKRPLMAVKAVETLLKEGYAIHLTMVGGIDNRDRFSKGVYQIVRDYINNHKLEKDIELTGALPHADVHKIMRKANVFLFTSSRFEGWGAVLNEAMYSGCVPVVSHLVGAAPYLIKQGENGIMFKSGSLRSLVESIKSVIGNRDQMLAMSKKAYQTVNDLWSPEVAADNLLELCKSLLKGDDTPITEGPCSKATPTWLGLF